MRKYEDFELKLNMKAMSAYAKMGLSIIAMLASVVGFLSDKDNLVVKGIAKVVELAARKPENAEQAQKKVNSFVNQHKQEIPPEQVKKIQKQMSKMVDIAREINRRRLMETTQRSVESSLKRSAEIAKQAAEKSSATTVHNKPTFNSEMQKNALEQMRLMRIKMGKTDSIWNRHHRCDVSPAVVMALKAIGPMLGSAIAGQVAGAVGDFTRSKILDPAIEATRKRAIKKLHQYEKSKGRNEPHSASILRGARIETEKLSKMLQRERLPITNLLHAAVNGLKVEEMNMLRDSRKTLRQDSRLKRSTKRPGRATAWEIKMAMGMNESTMLDPNYIGHVNARGDVIVMHKSKPNKIVAEISGDDLDRLVLMSRAGMLRGGNAGQWFGSSTDIGARARIQQNNERNMNTAAGKVANAASTAVSALNIIEKISEGLSSTINGAKRASENIKNAISSFNAAREDLRNA